MELNRLFVEIISGECYEIGKKFEKWKGKITEQYAHVEVIKTDYSSFKSEEMDRSYGYLTIIYSVIEKRDMG